MAESYSRRELSAPSHDSSRFSPATARQSSMTIPFARFHQNHLRSAGVNAPRGEVHVFLASTAGNGSSTAWRVEVVAAYNGALLARGDVTLNGKEVLHALPMLGAAPLRLSAVDVLLRFTGNGSAPVTQPFPTQIYLVRP